MARRRGVTEKPSIVRCIASKADAAVLKTDLAGFEAICRREGACDCAVIGGADIVFNPEVSAKVRAQNENLSLHWPLIYPMDDLEEAIRVYQAGLFWRMPPVVDMPDYGGGPVTEAEHRHLYLKIYEIVTAVESAAFYRGYHLALGLAAGNCRSIFCVQEKRCWPMLKGQACIRPNIGRPSMEAVGIDRAAMASQLNWEAPQETGLTRLAGLVMII